MERNKKKSEKAVYREKTVDRKEKISRKITTVFHSKEINMKNVIYYSVNNKRIFYEIRKNDKKVLESIQKEGGLYYVVLSERCRKNFGAASGRIFISRWRYYDGILGKCQPGGNA